MGINIFNKHKCPCCGYFTLNERANNTFQICPVCYWEDDGVQLHDSTFEGGANTVNLDQAKANFIEFGAVEKRFLKAVRSSSEEES